MHDHVPTRAERRKTQTEPARQAWLEKSAQRAADDDLALARAVRIVQAALERQRLSLDELTSREAS